MNIKKLAIFVALTYVSLTTSLTQAQTPASASYTPSWQARHHLQWLVDNAELQLTTSHWPLPAAAVQQALNALPMPATAGSPEAQATQRARSFVLNELNAAQTAGRVRVQLRSEAEALTGYGESYTPSSRAQMATAEGRWQGEDVSAAGRLGGLIEASPNSLQTQFSGMGTEGQYQVRPEGSEAVLGLHGWNAQVFSRQNWWGPGWQSSLINGHNNPAWLGVGVQRGSVAPSAHWLMSWMGPWNLDVFVAKAQDPVVAQNQPNGFLYSGMRLTLKPQPWLEVGLSRGLQTAGAGRPSGAKEFIKAFAGQQTNQESYSTFQDSSGQIAGYDARARCPKTWGTCAVYAQWMGEDSAGKALPLPYKFMTLYGVEQTYAEGRYRAFVEYANTFFPSNGTTAVGYTNGVYNQGYTQGARWVGSAQGGGAEVTTLGWMDVAQQRMAKVHMGRVSTSIGAYAPQLANAPHGNVWGLTVAQSFAWKTATLTPEFAYTHLDKGEDQRASKRNNVRLGLVASAPF